TVGVVPTIWGVALGVGLVWVEGVTVGVCDGLDDEPPQAASSSVPTAAIATAIVAVPPARVRRRARAGIPPPKRRALEGRSRLREATGIGLRSAPQRASGPDQRSPSTSRPRGAARRADRRDGRRTPR